MRGQEDVLERWFAAFNAHDMDALLEIAHPDVEVVPLGGAITAAAGAVFHGHDGVRSAVQPGFDRWPKISLGHDPPTILGGSAVVRFCFSLDDGNGSAATRSGAAVYDFRDGMILRMHAYGSEAEALEAVDGRRYGVLSPREREVLSLMSDGMTAPDVAERLFLSPYTVRTHVRNAKEKLGAATTGHAIAIAMRARELEH